MRACVRACVLARAHTRMRTCTHAHTTQHTTHRARVRAFTGSALDRISALYTRTCPRIASVPSPRDHRNGNSEGKAAVAVVPVSVAQDRARDEAHDRAEDDEAHCEVGLRLRGALGEGVLDLRHVLAQQHPRPQERDP
eukprot:gene4447-biopygen3962